MLTPKPRKKVRRWTWLFLIPLKICRAILCPSFWPNGHYSLEKDFCRQKTEFLGIVQRSRTTDGAELRAFHHHFQGGGKFVAIFFEGLFHGCQGWLIGHLNLAAQSITQQFFTKLVDECGPAIDCQVFLQALGPFEFDPVTGFGFGIDGTLAQVFGSGTAYGIETFQRKSKRVDANMATSTAGIA
jgi:hypothetical protein